MQVMNLQILLKKNHCKFQLFWNQSLKFQINNKKMLFLVLEVRKSIIDQAPMNQTKNNINRMLAQ